MNFSSSSSIILLLLTGSLFLGTIVSAVDNDMKSKNKLMKPTPHPTPDVGSTSTSVDLHHHHHHYSSSSSVEHNNNNEDNHITVYGLDRSVPLTKDETVYLEKTIKEAYDEIHHHHEGEMEVFVAAPSSSSVNILADVDDKMKPTENIPSSTVDDHDDNATSSLLSSNNDDDDSNRITVYGIDRTVPLTKEESEFLEGTIQEAYDETHQHNQKEGKSYKDKMFVHVVDINKVTRINNNDNHNKKSAESIPSSSNNDDDDVPTTSFLRAATRNPVVTEKEETIAEEETTNSATAQKTFSVSLTNGFVLIIIGSLYVFLA